MARRKITKSAVTGKIVSKEEAKAKPETTFTQTVEVDAKPELKACPEYRDSRTGEKVSAEYAGEHPYRVHLIEN